MLPNSTRDAAFRGTLQHFGLSSVLTVLEMERKSGLLVVSGPEVTEIARIFLRHGRVVRARLQARRHLEKQDVVYDALGWSRGSFEFFAVEVETEDEVGMTTARLLLEGARRLDDARRSTHGSELSAGA